MKQTTLSNIIDVGPFAPSMDNLVDELSRRALLLAVEMRRHYGLTISAEALADKLIATAARRAAGVFPMNEKIVTDGGTACHARLAERAHEIENGGL